MLRKNHSRICDLCVTEWLVVMCDLWWCAHSQVIKMKISCTRMFALFIACVKHLLVQTFVGITCRSQQSRRCSWVTNLKNILWLALTCTTSESKAMAAFVATNVWKHGVQEAVIPSPARSQARKERQNWFDLNSSLIYFDIFRPFEETKLWWTSGIGSYWRLKESNSYFRIIKLK